MKRRDVGSRIDRLADYIGLAPAIPGTAQRAGKTGPQVLEELLAIAGAPPVPRMPEETLALIEAERVGWGKSRPPAERAAVDQLAKLVGAPVPSDADSADQHGARFAAWLTESDHQLAGYTGRMTAPVGREKTGVHTDDSNGGHTP